MNTIVLLFRHLLFRARRFRYLLDTRHFCPGCLSRKTERRAVPGQSENKNKALTIIEERCVGCGGLWYTEPVINTENFQPAGFEPKTVFPKPPKEED